MECSQLRKELSAYLDGALPKDVQVEIDSHLRQCETCRKAADDMTAAWKALDLIEEGEPRDLRQKIWDRIGREERFHQQKRGRPWWIPLSAAAAVLLAIGVFHLFRPSSPDIFQKRMASKIGQENERPAIRQDGPPSGQKEEVPKIAAKIEEDKIIASLHLIEEKDFLEKIDFLEEMEYLLFIDSIDKISFRWILPGERG